MLSEIDILNRQEFIDKIISTVEYHSKNNLKASFSIQGEWGCGKSWILDRVFENLYDIQDEKIAGGHYCVFRYNAWKYDYYDEPLVSLLISLKEQLDSENSIIFKTSEAQENYRAIKKMIKEKLLDALDAIQKSPLFEIIDTQAFHIPRLICFSATIKKEFEKYKDKVKEEIRQYDPHYDLNQLMNSMIKGLNNISEEKTVVVIVDELDRCLPEHAIKVLERMHHISQNVNNIQFLYGIDKTQIENNVAQLFLPNFAEEKIKNDRIKKYLSKFLSFGLQVPVSEYTKNIEKKYPLLFDFFGCINTCSFDVVEKIMIVVNVVTPRILEQAINKIILINGILNINKDTIDNSILLFELFTAIAIELNFDWTNSHLEYDTERNLLKLSSSIYHTRITNIFNKLVLKSPVIKSEHVRFLSEKNKLYFDFDGKNKAMAIFEASITYYYEKIQNRDLFFFDYKEVTEEMNKNVDYLRQFVEYYKSLDM